MKNKIPKPIRIAMFLAGLIWIVFMWVKKDIAATLAAVPTEAAIPMIVISLVITLLKVGILTAVTRLLKWLASKLGGRRK